LEEKLPINLQIHVLQFAQQSTIEKEARQGRIDQLIELDEYRRLDFDQMERIRDKINEIFAHKAKQGTLKMVTLYLCGTRGKRIHVCIRSLIVYGLALTILIRSSKLIPFI
jgi:hypothetical protein